MIGTNTANMRFDEVWILLMIMTIMVYAAVRRHDD